MYVYIRVELVWHHTFSFLHDFFSFSFSVVDAEAILIYDM
jgi:hypothetical protein